MQLFKHYEAHSTEEACRLLAQYEGRAFLNAGGSDLLTLQSDAA
jgi:CO/xanthine dehydrogenase FAD-binding subunit